MADDLLARTRDEIRERLSEIEPLVEERDRLRAALAALEQIAPERRGARPAARRQRRPRPPAGRARRGQRRQELLALIEGNPGITPANAATLMEVAPSQVSGLARRLEDAGEIERRDGTLFRAGEAGPDELAAPEGAQRPESALPPAG